MKKSPLLLLLIMIPLVNAAEWNTGLYKYCTTTGCTMTGDINMNNNNLLNPVLINATLLNQENINLTGDINFTGVIYGNGSGLTDVGIWKNDTGSYSAGQLKLEELNSILFVDANDGSDIQTKLNQCNSTSSCHEVWITHPGTYNITTTIVVPDNINLHMYQGTWIQPESNINIIQLETNQAHPVRWGNPELGHIYINVSPIKYTKSAVIIDLEERIGGMKIENLVVRGRTNGNGTGLYIEGDTSDNGYVMFSDITVDAKGVAEPIFINNSVTGGCFVNGNQFMIKALDTTYGLRKENNGHFTENSITLYYEDWVGRNTSTNGIVSLKNSNKAERNRFYGMIYDLDSGEYGFDFNASVNNMVRMGTATCHPTKGCGSNTIENLGNSYTTIKGKGYEFEQLTRLHRPEFFAPVPINESGFYFYSSYPMSLRLPVCIGGDCQIKPTTSSEQTIFSSNPFIEFRDGSGGAQDFFVGADRNAFTIATSEALFNIANFTTTYITLAKETNIIGKTTIYNDLNVTGDIYSNKHHAEGSYHSYTSPVVISISASDTYYTVTNLTEMHTTGFVFENYGVNTTKAGHYVINGGLSFSGGNAGQYEFEVHKNEVAQDNCAFFRTTSSNAIGHAGINCILELAVDDHLLLKVKDLQAPAQDISIYQANLIITEI